MISNKSLAIATILSIMPSFEPNRPRNCHTANLRNSKIFLPTPITLAANGELSKMAATQIPAMILLALPGVEIYLAFIG